MWLRNPKPVILSLHKQLSHSAIPLLSHSCHMTFKLKNNILPCPDEELLDDLRNSSKKLQKDTISYDQKRHVGIYHPLLIARRFGSWNKALEKAGLRITQYRHTPHALLFDNIRNLWLTLGRQPVLSDLRTSSSRFGRRAYKSAFGSWKIALRKFVEYAQTAYKENGTTKTTKPEIRLPAAPGGRINWRLRHLIMKRDSFRCRACGASPASDPAITLHIDHIIPLSKGGTSDPRNLQTLCSICNIGKSDL